MRTVYRDFDTSLESIGPFASPSDYAACRKLHRRFGSSYYFASLFMPKKERVATDAIYGFVRVPDEWVDNPRGSSMDERQAAINHWRRELRNAMEGLAPDHPALRAFADTVLAHQIPLAEAMAFLDAMEQDLFVDRYETYDDLRKYMRGSAGAVGMMMCYVVAEYQTDLCQTCARLLGEAMQLTNFLRDVGEDANRGRIYLPREDLESFGVREKDIFEHRATPEFKQLMRFQIARARALYFESDLGIALLPKKTRRPVELARSLYSRILNRLEAQGCDPFIRRARTSKTEKILVALNLTFGRR